MGLMDKFFGERRSGSDADYVDLEKYTEKAGVQQPARMHVRVGEITRYEDLKNFSDYVFGGNVLLLDFSAIAGEEVIFKRVTNDLKKLVEEVNGDIAGIGNNLMIVSPSDVKIDRRKLRGSYS